MHRKMKSMGHGYSPCEQVTRKKIIEKKDEIEADLQ